MSEQNSIEAFGIEVRATNLGKRIMWEAFAGGQSSGLQETPQNAIQILMEILNEPNN